jgi:hypothetical protein
MAKQRYVLSIGVCVLGTLLVVLLWRPWEGGSDKLAMEPEGERMSRQVAPAVDSTQRKAESGGEASLNAYIADKRFRAPFQRAVVQGLNTSINDSQTGQLQARIMELRQRANEQFTADGNADLLEVLDSDAPEALALAMNLDIVCSELRGMPEAGADMPFYDCQRIDLPELGDKMHFLDRLQAMGVAGDTFAQLIFWSTLGSYVLAEPDYTRQRPEDYLERRNQALRWLLSLAAAGSLSATEDAAGAFAEGSMVELDFELSFFILVYGQRAFGLQSNRMRYYLTLAENALPPSRRQAVEDEIDALLDP